MVSCSTVRTVEVPLETIKIEYKDKIQYDSIYHKDSVLVLKTDDTVYVKKIQYLYKYRYIKDTVNIIDTIPKIVTVTKTEYINELYLWQKILMFTGILFILYFLIKFILILKQ